MRICSVDGCSKTVSCRGYCEMHYCRWRKYGDTLPEVPHLKDRAKPICRVEGCERVATSRGWCDMHYQRWKKSGDPLSTRQTPKGEPLKFLEKLTVGESGECDIWPYSRDGNGYAQTWINGRLVPVSRFLCEKVHGPAPTPHHQAAHSCGKGNFGCVTMSHLRWATPVENNADKMLHGTYLEGEANHASKLSVSEVREIKRLQRMGLTYDEIGERFGTCIANVSQIVNGRTWRSLNDA